MTRPKKKYEYELHWLKFPKSDSPTLRGEERFYVKATADRLCKFAANDTGILLRLNPGFDESEVARAIACYVGVHPRERAMFSHKIKVLLETGF